MTHVMVVPLVAPSGTLRVWIGASGIAALPDVGHWTLDGEPIADAAVRSVLPWSMVAGQADGGGSTLATGVWSLDLTDRMTAMPQASAPRAPVRHEVTVAVGDHRASCRTTALPVEMPPVGETFRILLCSCFDFNTSKPMLGPFAESRLSGPKRPHATLWLGDQVYLDQPLGWRPLESRRELEDRLRKAYVDNWFEPKGLGPLLALAPNVFTADDHEYWNNFPRASVVAAETASPKRRQWWTDCASTLYSRFQLGAGTAAAPALGQPVTLTIAPLAMLVLDTRSLRRDDHLMDATAAAALDAWARWIADSPDIQCAVIVTGQSVLAEEQRWLSERVGDAEMPDSIEGYRQLLDAFDRISDAGKRVLLITGDVHYGRFTRIDDARGDPAGWEVISSPISKVQEPWDRPKGWLGALTDRGQPWPAHADPVPAPIRLPAPRAAEKLGARKNRYATAMLEGQRGNHVALLSFAREGSGLRAWVETLPITDGIAHTAGNPYTDIDLRWLKQGERR